MSETIDAPDATRTSTPTRPSGRGPAHGGADTGAGSAPAPRERRVIDLDSVTDSVHPSAPAGGKGAVIAPPPVRDSSYYLG